MNKNRHKEDGFSHALLIPIAVLVIGTIGFAGYKVSRSNSNNNNQANYQSETDANKLDQSDSDKLEAEEEVAQEEQNTTESAPNPSTTSPSQSSTPKPKSSPSTNTTPQKRVISFTKGGGALQGDVVIVSATLSETQTGTCTYKFSLNGTERVSKTSSLTNSNKCYIEVPLSAFPKSSTYSLEVSFVSSDGLVSAKQAAYDIEVHPDI